MHNNYYFLRQLSSSLETVLNKAVISGCFSQDKDELITRFETSSGSFYIKASVLPGFSCLSFPPEFHRARKNSVDLFGEMIGLRVNGIRQFKNERSFALILSEGHALLFKMHGNRANILLLEDDRVIRLFRNNIKGDHALKPDALDRDIDFTFETFLKHPDDLSALYFTFGKVVWRYLHEHQFASQSPEQKWDTIQSVRRQLERPSYYIVETDHEPVLALLKTGTVQKEFHEPIAAVNEFYSVFTQCSALHHEKTILLSALKGRLQAGESYYKKNSDKLHELAQNNNYRIRGDLIMANLHNIKPNAESVTLADFYQDNHPLEIRLKKDLTPQKNAEVYYKKAKNQQGEIARLQQALLRKEQELLNIHENIKTVESCNDLKTLKKLHAGLKGGARQGKDTGPLPYHEFTMNGFRIWVGKNSQSNDILTLRLAGKNDLWLHARDVAGSHVVVKYQPGKNFPKDVIERAAQLAAYNSKRKNETLCPVIVTQKKFVRKRKGDPAGVVVVEKEEIIMAEPKL